jgi:transcriptional regulator with GAF, ATPase, and Fis domain
MEKHAAPPRVALSREHIPDGLIGNSGPKRLLNELIGKISRSNSPVLLLGEAGTGKEVVARAIHSQGLRREKVLVPVDCSALTPTLESELFGHLKGAFTRADRARRGLLQIADGGTVFRSGIERGTLANGE